MSAQDDYWEECIAIAAEECDLTLSKEQLDHLAYSVKMGHEHYGYAFYSPSWGERISDIEDEYKQKIKDLEHQIGCYQSNAERAVKSALKLYDDTNISIGEGGEVWMNDGCCKQIL